MSQPQPDIPQGFEPVTLQSPAIEPWKPIYARRLDDSVQLGVIVREPHCNSRGFMHGGVVAALADNAMIMSYVHRHQQLFGVSDALPVTASLAVDYIASAQKGMWMQIDCRVIRAGRTTGIVDAVASAGGETLARFNATFRYAR